MSYSVQVLVVDIATGNVTDSGGGNDYPDLPSVGPVVTDYPGQADGALGGGRAAHSRDLRG